jgi:protein-tyrosine phosphatase
VDERAGPLLIVCRANLIRSPLAAALVRSQLQDVGRVDLDVSSAGLHVVSDARAGSEASEVAMERGIDLSGHRPVQVVPEMLVQASLVVTMTEEQRAAAVRLARVAVPYTFSMPELVRLLSSRESPPARSWATLAQQAHAMRPFVAGVPEPEDVPDPVGRERHHHEVVADTMVSLAQDLVRHLVPAPSGTRGR